ncbi:MAG: UDP-N-acetylglucosamine 1-carboxyvinyltransferase [Kiritimatiellae bacterium]|nr:UDP-N-acetylglucosamine 1-carboxyvinyltransferase [Kiritimatiellia bacterium]
MATLIVSGGRKITGTHRVSGNKNAALPMIAAALLTSEPVTLTNLPAIDDVERMLEVAKNFGVKVTRNPKDGSVTLTAGKIRSAKIDPALAARIRTSFLFAGPLLARLGRVSLPPPGGDAIGHRRLDTHFAGFRALGAVAKVGRKTLAFKGSLTGAKILLDEASVTATENILMAAVLASGRTEIYNAACEPHVVDLAALLNAMGAKVSGAGTNLIVVEGVESLHGCTVRIGCDYIEAGSYIVAAAVTGGELMLTEIDPEPFAVLEKAFARFGVTWTIDRKERTLRYVPRKRLKMRYDLGDAIPSIADGIWPAFPSDLLSILIVLATQTRGTCLFFEKMFESRLYFVDHLKQMGAKIVQCDPHRVVVTGPSTLIGETVTSPDIRAGIALVIAALCAKGETVIQNAESIDRGYVSVEDSLGALGANIVRKP